METLNKITIETYSWGGFLVISLLLFAIYLLLQLAGQRLTHIFLPARIQLHIDRLLRKIILLYEPISAFILISVFILIDPYPHGIFIALIILVGFPHFKNYLSGRLVRFDPGLRPGVQLESGRLTGIVSRMGRLGLYIQTHQGNHFINHSVLLSEGYTLISEEEIGGFYQLLIGPVKEETLGENQLQDLADRMIMVPFQVVGHKPELTLSNHNQIMARVLVREERHLQDFISLIKEWGYTCSVSNSKQ